MELMDLHRVHARHLTATRRAPGTVVYYHNACKRLGEYMAGAGLTDVAELTKGDMQGFALWLRERGLSPGGEHAVMRGVRATLRWAAEEELLERDPMRRVKLLRVPQVRPPAVTPELAREALKAAERGRYPARDRAAMLVMFDTGVRMGELLALTTDDVDMRSGFIRVRAETSKRQKERRLPFGVKTGRALAHLERKRRPARPAMGELFLSREGLPWTKSGLHHMLKVVV